MSRKRGRGKGRWEEVREREAVTLRGQLLFTDIYDHSEVGRRERERLFPLDDRSVPFINSHLHIFDTVDLLLPYFSCATVSPESRYRYIGPSISH